MMVNEGELLDKFGISVIGVGAIENGSSSIGVGTSSAISMTLDALVFLKDHQILLNHAALPGKWEYEPPIWNTGGLIKWFHDKIEDEAISYEDLYQNIEAIPLGANGVMVLPYFSGAGSPRWNADMKGGIYGLNLSNNKYDILKAILESIAFEICYNLDVIRASDVELKEVILSGGASKNRPLCQIISDVLNISVQVSKASEASSRGIFVLIKCALLETRDFFSVFKSLKNDIDILIPNKENHQQYQRHYHSYLKLGNAMETFHQSLK